MTKYYGEEIVDYIGYQAEKITFAITATYLIYSQHFVLFLIFCVGKGLNIILNEQLKERIREPRPRYQVPYIDHMSKNSHVWGMPSGHAQGCFYAFVFLWLAGGSPFWLFVSFVVCGLTLIQRWKFRRHTVEQLGVGSLVGTVFAYGLYTLGKYFM